ncbi:hypothetical protein LTR36_005269 [Oleoguttula mirabilis]|uniref:Uncharacterized protein n=1 Tax=Oleoguttula mirabilis TaxID=1507867 RepID=A0AAV9JE99_9PEZI|nr:hypothetical protein LTR36_005269 [Oleoguttula mirabilis]
MYPSSSSFVRSAIEAWGRHSHLVLRPDDIWFAILVQMNFFMEKNAESLRHLFVAHQNKVVLQVWGCGWQNVVDKFEVRLQDNIKTPWMTDWVSPGFTTSTKDDERTAIVLMMGLMKAFFDYEGGVICGIPSVTLLGTRKDWQRLLKKIDRLDDFGAEPRAYAHRLRPILSRMAQTFDSPVTTDTQNFWNQMVQAKVKHSSTCGEPETQYTVSGWILGFFYWDSTGRTSRRFSEGWAESSYLGSLLYDDVHYGEAALEDLPMGYAKAAFKMFNGHGESAAEPFKGWVLAGSIGKSIVAGAPEGYKAALALQHGSKQLEAAKHDTDDPGCFSGLLRGLNCFRATHKSPAEPVHITSEKQAPQEVTREIDCENDHSTIQPRSGWFLFGPDKDVGPFFDTEEIDGPTVDAINSCEGVEHCQS